MGKTIAKTTELYVNIALWLLLPTVSLISHTLLPIPPILVFFVASIPFVVFAVDKSTNASAIPIKTTLYPVLIAFLIYISYMVLNQCLLHSSMRSVFSIASSALYFPIVLMLLQGRDLLRQEKKKIDILIVVSLIVYTVEMIWRYTNAFQSGAATSQDFYLYKVGGMMYSDSNMTGIHILIMLFFTLGWVRLQWLQRDDMEQKELKRYIWIIFFWCILALLTLSRACWIGAIVGMIYYWLSAKNPKMFWLYAGIAIVVSIVAFMIFIYPLVKYDESFMSKFQILYAFMDYVREADLYNLLFGVGLYRSETVMGIYAHNYLLVFIVETGIIGALLMIYAFIQTIITSRGETLIILLPFFVTTMSATAIFLPDLYLSLAIICIWWIQKKESEDFKRSLHIEYNVNGKYRR